MGGKSKKFKSPNTIINDHQTVNSFFKVLEFLNVLFWLLNQSSHADLYFDKTPFSSKASKGF